MAELLVDTYPEIAQEWHSTKNGTVRVDEISANSSKEYWWQCPRDPRHEWKSRVSTRTRYHSGCQYCSGKKVLPEDSFAALYPELLAEWHPTKNEGIDPEKLSPNSNKKVWWRCSKNPKHEWATTIIGRTQKGSGCRQCLWLTNSLAKAFPKIAKEWHPTKNEELTPNDVPGKTRRQVWWLCSADPTHEWKMSIEARTSAYGSCPHCRQLQTHKRLPKLSEFSVTLAAEWHPTKNGTLTPHDVTAGSNKKVWWVCPQDKTHEWPAIIRNRARRDQGCPICANTTVDASNSLATLFPEIAREWHPTQNGTLTPHDVSKGSAKRVWWQCLKNPEHVWDATIVNRTHNHSTCPECSGHLPNESNSLQTKFPEIAQEWHSEKNGTLTPADVTVGSGRKVWWQCSIHPEHEWQAQIKNRTILNSGCPICSRERGSQELSDALADSVSSNTDFYATFRESIDTLRELLLMKLSNNSLHQPFLRMIYANSISIMETYLSDAFIQTATSDKQYITTLLQTDPEFKERKYTVNEILVWEEFSKDTVTKYLLDKILWHNVYKIANMYKAVLQIEFPDSLSHLAKIVAIRHDIVHRNGKNKKGEIVTFTVQEVEDVIEHVRALIMHIDRQLHIIRNQEAE